MTDKKEPDNLDEDFDDFGFADDEEEFSGEESGDDFGMGAEAAKSGASPSVTENFSDDLLAEMEKAEAKKPPVAKYFDHEAIISWAKDNKLLAGGGAGVVAVILLFMMMSGGPSSPVPQHSADLTPITSPSEVAHADHQSDQNLVASSADDLAAFEYKDRAALQPRNAQAVEAPVPVVAEQSHVIKELESKISALEARLNTTESHLSTLQGMSQALNRINSETGKRDNAVTLNQQNIRRVEAAIAALNSSLQRLERDRFRSALLDRAEFVANGGNKGQQADYIVMASIPGRAWLRNQDGVLITVREGEAVPGFGQVKTIDPAAGEVVMTDNTVFKEEQ